MRVTLKQVFKQLIFNIKPLLLFEALYRLLGIFIVYPIARLLFHWSISISGYTFITNSVFTNYLFSPSTIAIFFLIGLLLSFYLVIELIFLALLFDLGHHNLRIQFLPFMLLGLKNVWKFIYKYHIFIIVPSFVFLVLVESSHLVGFVSTLSIPDYIINRMNSIPILRPLFLIAILISIVLFIESAYSIHLYVIDHLSFRNAYKESRLMLKKSRFKIVYQFVVMNILLNAILFIFYILIIALVALIISVTRGYEYVLGFLLTFLYSTYALLGYLATMILIPVNFAMISSWYYQYYEKMEVVKESSDLAEILEKIDLKWIKRGLIFSLSVIFILNITNVYSSILEPANTVDLLSSVEIIAHRGASKDAPENTLAAIELAIEQGANTIEMDVQMTLDLVPVLFHDTSIRRTTNIYTMTALSTLTLEELKLLDAGSWFSADFEGEKVPTLQEALVLIDGRVNLFIDMKNNSPTFNQLIVSLIEEYGMVNQTTILSANLSQLKDIKELNPDLKTLLHLSIFFGDTSLLTNNQYVDAYGFERSFVSSSPTLVEAIRLGGKKVYIGTFSDPSQINDILQYSIDGIYTSVPYVAREVIYSYRTNDSYVSILERLFNRNS